MKRTLLFIACVLASLAIPAQDVENIQNSGCLWQTRGNADELVPTIVLQKEGSILSVQLLNYESNCATEGFDVKNSMSEGSNGVPSLTVNVYPYGDDEADCICPYNVSFTIRDLEANTFYLKCWWYEGLVELTEGQSYQATYGGSFYSYHPFLKEGKTWNYQEYYHNVWDNQQWTKEVSYVINGTTEIDGKTYYKMFRISEDGNNYYCALREEERKVWQYTSDEGDHLLYDFGMSVGDGYMPSYEPYYYQLTSINPLWFHDDQLLNVYYYDIYDSELFASASIVEGVGCEEGWNITVLYACQPSNGIIFREQFLSCYEDGKCIFTADDFNHLTAADDMVYRPFVEDGKVWKVGALNSGNPVQWIEYYYFDGDTIIDGKTCKQMMCQLYVSPDFPGYGDYSQLPSLDYVGAWYEEDKKVYTYDSVNNQFKLMYDYSLQSNSSLEIDNLTYVIGPRQTGGVKGFKGVYRDVWLCLDEGKIYSPTWLEGVGSIDCPTVSIYTGYVDPAHFLMSCSVGDEVIYLNEEYEDGATPAEGRKRFDFTHTIKIQPKAPMRSGAMQLPHGEYNNLQLAINLEPLSEDYIVRITNEEGKNVYEKTIDTGSIVGLGIDISAYAEGAYTVIVENSYEYFTGTFATQTSGIVENSSTPAIRQGEDAIYNLQGQRLSSLQRGLNIVNGKKVYR